MKKQLLVEYKDIFGEPSDSIDFLLDGIDTNILVKCGGNFLKGFYNDIDFLCLSGEYFSTNNGKFSAYLYFCLSNMRKKNDIVIFNNQASLIFLEYVLSMPSIANDNKNPQFEINILKAYFLINQRLVAKENPLLSKLEELNSDEKIASYLFYQALAYSDYTNYDYNLEVFYQTVKAIMFFQYCEDKLPNHLALFCRNYKKENWKEYLKSYLFIPFKILAEKNKKISIVRLYKNDRNYHQDYLFLKSFSINEHIKQNDKDFTQIRMYPLFQKSEEEFVVLFDLFTAERIFRSLYFDFNEINESNELIYIKGFRTTITDNFSEKTIFYNLLDEIFDSEIYIHFKGSEYKDYDPKIEGEPDYYVRNENKVLVFESKDNLLNAETKTSYDYDKITDDLSNKLNKKKGIKQLCNNIENILKKILPLDSDYNSDDISIYPILVLHERIYSNMGLNYIINGWYKASIKRIIESIDNPKRIKQIIILDIDTLILLQNLNQNKQLNFIELLDKYISETDIDFINVENKLEETFFKQYESFKDFVESIIMNEIRSQEDPNKYFKSVIMQLFISSE